MEQPPPAPETRPDAATPPPTMSLTARLMNVVAAPGETFAELRVSPVSAANWLVPALLIVLISWIGGWLILSQDSIKHQMSEITSQGIEKQIEKSKMSKEQADKVREVGEKWGSIGTKVMMVAAPVFVAFISPFWGGLILWLFGVKAFKGNFTYMKAVEAAGLANMVGVLDAILRTLLILTLGNLFAAPSLALLVRDFNPQNPVHSLLAVVNVMTFWLLIVRSVALARLSGVSFVKAALPVFGVWALLTGVMVGFGFAMRALAGG